MVLLGGQFKSATHGQFKSAQGGQFDRILHLNACGENINKKGQGIAVLTPFVQILRSKNTYCLYEIKRNDLEKISKNDINTIIIDYSSGQMVYDTQVGKRKYHKIAATSILKL